ncbi:MAG: OmpA family protein [Flavobacteriales bacterium]|nr:OmpA family protein [Flavobacteriales bacterium]MCB9166459.1 OmpA family protein [Flavobacteriales bacterium]
MERIPHLLIWSFVAQSAIGQSGYLVERAQLEPSSEDYAPVLLDSNLVFCSIRERPGAVRVVQADTDEPLADLYMARYPDNGPSNCSLLSEGLASPFNDGPATFSPVHGWICFTRNLGDPRHPSKAKGGGAGLGLFFASRTGKEEVTPFAYNDPGFSNAHPTISADGGTLIFASDRPGGFGGMDLYRCRMMDSGWSGPENLGSAINGPDNEVFPFLHPNGTLYFSSSRPGGLGKLDIYSAIPVNGGWSTPLALPEPLNSAGNDLGYTSFPTDVSGAFSSDRDGTDAIFLFTRTPPSAADCPAQEENNYCYRFDEGPKRPMKGLPLKYRWDMGDGTLVDGTVALHCYERPGRYAVHLDLIDTLDNSIFFTEARKMLEVADIQQPYISGPDSARTGRSVRLDGRRSNLPDLFVEDMRWDFGDGTRGRGRAVTHAFRAPGTYTVHLNVLTTDPVTGVLADQCIQRDIVVIDRFKDQEDAVLASYKDASGVTREFAYQTLPSDQFELTVKQGEDVKFTVELFATRERLSLNDARFTEIRKFFPVIERYDPERGVYTYSVGNANTLAEMYAVLQKVKQLRFLDAEVMVIAVEKVTDLSHLALVELDQLNNTVVRSSSVYFATDQAGIDPEFLPQLDRLVDILRDHPGSTLVIEAHTDSRGTEAHNMVLSGRRAEALVAHFIGAGIAADRLFAIGYGEDQPIADNRTEKGRGLNRRVDFRFRTGNAGAEQQARTTQAR